MPCYKKHFLFFFFKWVQIFHMLSTWLRFLTGLFPYGFLSNLNMGSVLYFFYYYIFIRKLGVGINFFHGECVPSFLYTSVLLNNHVLGNFMYCHFCILKSVSKYLFMILRLLPLIFPPCQSSYINTLSRLKSRC